MKLSLCIIAGNEAAHIVRLLESFKAGFDELSLTIAIGAETPDNTADLAGAWCHGNGKGFVLTRYLNGPDQEGWKHVDNFAAARNQSFASATGDWLVWADCDDVIDDAAKLRELAASGTADMYRLPYNVPDAKKLTTRERLIRAELFKRGRIWRWSVHENLLIYSGDKWENATAPTFIHRPVGAKAGGDKRNLRILTAALREAPTCYYYCHQENFYLRNRDAARRFGDLFLQLPQRPPVLEYQCLLNLAELSDRKEEGSTYALRAHHLYPKQKEALAMLVKCAFQQEHADAALHWSKLLVEMPTPDPATRLWCYEPKWDGWAAWDLRARALRYAGKNEAADGAQQLTHAGPIEFSLIHATRGRVNQAINARETWLETADDPQSIEHIFAFDDDDEASCRWLKSFNHVVCTGRTCVDAWNRAAEKSRGRVLIQLSDDWQPPRGWDTALRATYAGRDPLKEQFVVAINDGTRKDQLLCMAILSRARYEAQTSGRAEFANGTSYPLVGPFMFWPEYESVFSDNEFSHRAYRDGIVIEARHLTFTHHHPAFGKGQMDETYKRQNAPEKYRRGLETFLRRNPDAPRPMAVA